MGAIQGLLEAAEWAAKRPWIHDATKGIMKLEDAATIAPTLQHLITPAMATEKPGLELSRRLAMEEMTGAKAAAKSVKESLLPDFRIMGNNAREAWAFENPGKADKAKALMHKKNAEEQLFIQAEAESAAKPDPTKIGLLDLLLKSPKEIKELGLKPKSGWPADMHTWPGVNAFEKPGEFWDNMTKEHKSQIMFTPDEIANQKFLEKKTEGATSGLWLRMTPEKKADLYRKSGLAKVLSFHESQPEKLSNLLTAAEEAGRGVEGGVEPTLALPSVAH